MLVIEMTELEIEHLERVLANPKSTKWQREKARLMFSNIRQDTKMRTEKEIRDLLQRLYRDGHGGCMYSEEALEYVLGINEKIIERQERHEKQMQTIRDWFKDR